MKQKIFLIIGIVLLSFFWISIYNEFMANHAYYQTMLASRVNRKLIIRSIVAVCIPIAYIIRSKVFSVKRFFITIIPLTLMFYTAAFTMVKGGIVWWSAGFIILMLNTLLLYFLGVYFVLGIAALGTWISKKFIKFTETRRQEMLINFWIWLGIFLLIVYIFSMIHLLRGAVIRILFLGIGYIYRRTKNDMLQYKTIISDIADEFRGDKLKSNRRKRIGVILLAISIIYYLYGFQLSFIPYSTAWDANHEYMYIPKVLAQNHGVLRGNAGVASAAPQLWHVFITFRFSLINPIKSRFRLAPDTIAVSMNFISGIFVLIFGTGLIKEVLSYFSSKKTEEDDTTTTIGMYSGRMMLLFRLTSWMGAFLVFVDNKTDLGVMALTILAILSGFIFLKHIFDNREHGLKLHRDSLKYIIISGVMFAWASMAKPTAFIDIALFGLLLIGLRIDSIIAIGAGIMTVGITGVLQIANAPDMMTPAAGKYVVLIGLIVVVLGIIRMIMNKNDIQGKLSDKKRLFKYICIWLATLIITLLVFKWPNMLIKQVNDHTLSPGTFIKSILLGKQETKVLLAATDTKALAQQTAVDETILATSNLSPDQCKQMTFTKEELNADVKKAVTSNEDVGRYVGYGRKEISKNGRFNLGYGLLRIFYPKNNVCYGTDRQAKKLCTNAQAIENFNVPTLKTLFAQAKPWTEVYGLLSWALAAYQEKWSGTVINPTEYRDQIVALRQYYQNHAIKTEAGKISVPYRYLVPFNVVFNRSLQNLSSYYTDIGFVRLLIFMLLVLGFVYALFNAKRFRQDTNLVVLSSVTIIGRAIRWIIGWGIVRYGMGLVMRTVIAVAMILRDMFEHSTDEKEKTMIYILMFLFVIRGLVQLILNFVRISSQGGTGPFLRYKMNNGKSVEISTSLQQKEIVKAGYGRKDVFDLQFPHYNKFINYVKNRKNTDGVLIAGTYMPYFLDNQRNIKNDGMLSRFREQNSDGNMCKSYQRLRDNNLKYLVIDPNIWTVVMGEGNESLFNRFFAKKDPVTGKIEEDGAISNLVKLRKAGYINLFSTNNLWAKYAFSLDDAAFKAKFGNLSADDLIFMRAKLSVARFFPDAQELLNFIGETFTSRIADGKVIGDIADVYGKDVDESKLFSVAQTILSQKWASEELTKTIEWLSQDERLILMQYLGLINISQSNSTQYQEFVSNILNQSLGGGSQLIVFELN